jgi:1-hydroxycarotenoid 3,4-desaturase
MPRPQRIVVIGAGVGGLVAALELARQGREVLVLEAAAAPGGKLRRSLVEGVAIEAGPALLTLRPLFESTFAAAGSSLDAHLALTPQTLLGRHIFADGSRLDLPVDPQAAEAAIGRFAGAAALPGYRAFRARARAAFETLEGALLQRARPSALALAAQARLGRLLATGPFTTLWDALGTHFADPRLRQLFARTASHVGSSPFQAPATLMLVAEVEQRGGWWVEGGMTRLAEALATLARAQGAQIRLGTPVAAVLVAGGRASGVRLADGETIACDAVVCNADPAALAAGRLGAAAARALDPLPVMRRSFSALTWAMRAGLPADAVAQTVLHAPDAQAEYTALAFRGRLPAAPSIALWAQDRPDGAAPPAGAERLLALISAPARGDSGQPDAAAVASCQAQVFARLAAAGLPLAPGSLVVTGPAEWEKLAPGTGGALYGPAVQGWQATFSRPAAATRLPGLVLAGGGTHPGAGLAMAALSGRLAAAQVIGEQG